MSDYDGEARFPASPLSARLARELPGVAPDARLDAAAADLATVVGDGGTPPWEVVHFALWYRGVVEPTPRIIILTLQADDQEKLAADLRARLKPDDAAARFGVGAAKGGKVVVLLLRSGIRLDPVPRAQPKGGVVKLHGDVLPPRANPRVLVTRQDGSFERATVTAEGATGFRAEIACGDVAGKLKVEVTAMSPGRPSVLANFPVWCGTQPPRAVTASGGPEVSEPTDPRKAELELFTLVNEDRRRVGLPPLIWDDAAAAVARAHTVDMRDHNFVAHISPTTGSTADRVRAAHLGTPVILENLGVGATSVEIEEGLMNSPGHRANITSTQATHLGVGATLAPGAAGRAAQLYITQLFIRQAPEIDPQTAASSARAAIDGARAKASLAPLTWDDGLARLADEQAQQLAASGDTANAAPLAPELQKKYGAVMRQMTVTADLTDAAHGNVLDPAAKKLGIGVRQATHAVKGKGTYYVITLVAK